MKDQKDSSLRLRSHGSASPGLVDPMAYLEDQCFELARLYHVRRDLAIPPHMGEFQASNLQQVSRPSLQRIAPDAPMRRESQEYSEEKEIHQTDNSSHHALDEVGFEIAQGNDNGAGIIRARRSSDSPSGTGSEKKNSGPEPRKRNSEQPFDPLPWLLSESDASDSESDVRDGKYSPDTEKKRRRNETDRKRRQRIKKQRDCKPPDSLECPDKDHDKDEDPKQSQLSTRLEDC
ncbi:unnamed protein product [Caenorhabditis nigoni]